MSIEEEMLYSLKVARDTLTIARNNLIRALENSVIIYKNSDQEYNIKQALKVISEEINIAYTSRVVAIKNKLELKEYKDSKGIIFDIFNQ